MRVFKIFLRLKCEEIWDAVKFPVTVVVLVVGATLVMWIIMGLIGLLVSLLLGIPIVFIQVMKIGFCGAMALTLMGLICHMFLCFAYWIRSNWRRAKELAKAEGKLKFKQKGE